MSLTLKSLQLAIGVQYLPTLLTNAVSIKGVYAQDSSGKSFLSPMCCPNLHHFLITVCDSFKNIFIEFIGVTLINKIPQVSGIQFYNMSSVYCFVYSPPQVKSLSITINLPLTPLPQPPFPSGCHHTVVCVSAPQTLPSDSFQFSVSISLFLFSLLVYIVHQVPNISEIMFILFIRFHT